MGAWGAGPFDNDEAADFLDEAAEGSIARVVVRTLRAITRAPVDRFIEVDEGGAAWAALRAGRARGIAGTTKVTRVTLVARVT